MQKSHIFILVAGSCLFGTSAAAHPVLESSSPPSDKVADAGAQGRAETAPKSITLEFSERVVARFSGASIEDGDGHKVATGPATTDVGDARRLVVPLASPLPAGRYTVDWHAVSDDTHRVKGRYSFTVAR